jgi:hypothetical protein
MNTETAIIDCYYDITCGHDAQRVDVGLVRRCLPSVTRESFNAAFRTLYLSGKVHAYHDDNPATRDDDGWDCNGAMKHCMKIGAR